MNLVDDSQYQMVEISRFHVTKDKVDDILLMPAIIEKSTQI